MFKKYSYFLFYWIVKRTVGYTWKTSACFQTNSKVLKSDTELKEQFSNLEALPFSQKIKLDIDVSFAISFKCEHWFGYPYFSLKSSDFQFDASTQDKILNIWSLVNVWINTAVYKESP